jgi:hypothetical protein
MIRRLWNAILRDLKLISPTLIFVSGVYVAIGATLFFLIGDHQNKFGSLVSNIFAGSIDTLIVVVIISFLIARSARQELSSLRFAAYAQMEQAIRLFEFNWAGMLIASSRTTIQTGMDLVTPETVTTVAEHLNLDAQSEMNASWFARAGAAGQILRTTLNEVISRHARALESSIILKCIALEKSILVSALANITVASAPFWARGITMGKPFMLKSAATELGSFDDFLVMLRLLATEFESEPEFKAPVSFKMRVEHLERTKLGSAYID